MALRNSQVKTNMFKKETLKFKSKKISKSCIFL